MAQSNSTDGGYEQEQEGPEPRTILRKESDRSKFGKGLNRGARVAVSAAFSHSGDEQSQIGPSPIQVITTPSQ